MKATRQHAEQIADAIERDCAKAFDNLRISRAKINAGVDRYLSAASDCVFFHQGSFLMAVVQDNPFAEKRVSSIDAIHLKKATHLPILLKEFTAWVDARPAVRMTMYSCMHCRGKSFAKVLARFGFVLQGYVFRRDRT